MTPTFTWHENARLVTHAGQVITRSDFKDLTFDTPTVQLNDAAAAMCFFFDAFERRGVSICVDNVSMSIQHADPMPTLSCQTGGTTQAPKTVRRSCASWINSFPVNMARFGGHDQTVATLGDLSHSLTLYAACETLSSGATYLSLMGFRGDVLTQLADATVLYATPTQIRMLALRNPTARLSKLRHVMIGGGKLDMLTRKSMSHLAPNAVIHQFYGSAETSFVTITDASSPPDSVGRAFEGVQIKITDSTPDTGIGEIWVKSPYVFMSYAAGASTETREKDGWVSVGERGHLDQTGNLFLAGRKSRMFTVADKNVYPEQIETLCLMDHDIDACAVIPEHDTLRGARIVLMIATQVPDAKDRVTKLLSNSLPAHLRPHKIVVIPTDEWPMLASGKPDLQTLQSQVGTV